jgi:putative membrane-bound dehydrogenase-like protein
MQLWLSLVPFPVGSSTAHAVRSSLPRVILLVALFMSGLVSDWKTRANAPPRMHDDRLELTLFASEPDIVTPIGIAIDTRDRIFVIESHTHMPPSDYPGPKTDWIKIFEDTNRDGKADRIMKFAEGFIDAMNLAFSPEGVLHVVCARDVWRLPDANDDGVCDGAELLLKVETSNYYPHATLLGITFGPDGWLYVSRGNNGSAHYVIRGTDGSFVEGWGDGGNVIRCRPDGSNVEEYATGFWNPFDIRFDSYGRLLATDNDPDARGPNRLLHIVPHGDYGYRSLHGGGGNHPFQGWDGDLPGTLPYLAGTGEAPSGFIDANRTALPVDYRDQLLVTVWNENTIHRFVPQPRGVSITATNAVWMSGDDQFRPVAFDADSRGNLFITDWVLVDYPNHGRGRIWRVSTKPGEDKLVPRPVHTTPKSNPAFDPFNQLLTSRDAIDYARLEHALRGEDPFLRHAATVALSRPVFRTEITRATQHPDARVRLGALLALQRAQIPEPQPFLRRFLADPQEMVRRAALIWTGESGLVELRPAIDGAIDFSELSAGLFETYLAAVELLDPDFVEARRVRAHDRADRLKRKLDPAVIDALLTDPSRPPNIRALAMTRLESPLSTRHRELLLELARDGHLHLRVEALRTLGQAGTDAVLPGLRAIALDPAQSPDARAEALLALAWQPAMPGEEFINLLRDPHPTVRSSVIHLLRRRAWDEPFRPSLQHALERASADELSPALIEQLEFALFPPGTPGPRTQPRPDTIEAWHETLATGGDPVAGARVFYSPFTACASCHQVQNRGGRIGPDLSNIGQSVSREQIIESILRPSEQFAPQWQAWFVELTDGDQHQGLQLDHKSGGDIELFTTDGVTRRFRAAEIASYGVLPNSLMPDGLEEAMTVSEFRDLVAFLKSLH